MNEVNIIQEVEKFVRDNLQGFDSGHDWWHLDRVRNIALYIQRVENKGNKFLIELSALLHDIDDNKFRTVDSPSAAVVIKRLLQDLGVEENLIDGTIRINKYISFSSSGNSEIKSPEFLIVQDADRLDAIGAIGIARAFNYGGFRNNPIYIPGDEDPLKDKSTIGHFYEKLLKLKDLMNTSTARKLAEGRHLLLETYLEQFYNEWELGKI